MCYLFYFVANQKKFGSYADLAAPNPALTA